MSHGQASGTSLRERKKLATREALARTALRLAIERGLDNVRVEDITDAVNVSRRTFTNYFSCKEEAIASVNAERSARIVEALRERPADEPLAYALAEVFAEQYEEAAAFDRHDIERIEMVTSSPALRGEFLKTLVDAELPLAEVIAERTGTDLQSDLLPRVLAAAVFSASRAAVGYWRAIKGTESLPSLVRQAVLQVAGTA
ncbi:MAG: TetR/AcrR family transcriptional regulator [Streptosporangiaceae bacterium]